MRPSDVLAHKRIMLTKAAVYPSDGYGGFHAEILAELLPDAPCYYVTEDMAGVAKHAARTMPDQPLRVDDPPTRTGFMLWDAPVSQHEWADQTSPICGVAWAMHHYQDRPAWDGLDPRADPPPTAHETGDELHLSPLTMYGNTLVPCGEYGMLWDVGETPDLIANADDAPGLGKVLTATWALMGQSLTVTVPTKADRSERRRSERAGLPTDLLVVRLRRLSSAPLNEDGPEGCTDYSHRWLVSGHWRNQWLPSKGAHRLQWIAAHVKGPDNKPLIIKEKVTAWIR